jgi:hypothetical protein
LEKAGLAVAIAEVRDIPHQLKTTAKGFHQVWHALGGSQVGKLMAPKNVADHFLNHQFGWVPFLKDLSDFSNVIQNSVEYASRIANENNHWVKRKAILVNDFTSQVIDKGVGLRVIPNNDYVYGLLSGDPTFEITKDVLVYATAMGKYKYYRPEFDRDLAGYYSIWAAARREATMLGLRVNPSNIYKATPWTWAIDWFTHFGRNVDRINDILEDSVAFKYLFLMHHRLETYTFSQTLPLKDGGTRTLVWTRVIECKQRVEGASPYGIDLPWRDLSARQLAILGALGITRIK